LLKLFTMKPHDSSLFDHFSYLAGEGSEPVLRAIMQKATGVREFEGNLVVSFAGNEELWASPAGDRKKYEKWPDSFQEYVARHEYLSFGTEHWELCLGKRKDFHFESRLLSQYDKNRRTCTAHQYIHVPIMAVSSNRKK
jgi:hypothetical protein